MCAYNSLNGRYLAATALFRGRVSNQEVNEEIINVQNRNSNAFIERFPHDIKTSICEVEYNYWRRYATIIANSTSVQEMLQRISKNFEAMFTRRSLDIIHSIGMDELEYIEAKNNLNTLINEYQQIENGIPLE